ncbi:MAG: response regulator transcription factor [Planctomycetota bacterium]|nr:response regulator transcription factor [Planctomycetota bacterium]
MRVLVVEDSEKIRRAVTLGLRDAGYAVDEVADGQRGLIHLRTTEYDVAILDIMLPGLDGLSVLREARAKGVTTAVLMLTARDGVDDRVAGLRTGADDYLIKPFAFEELLARVEAMVRRRHGTPTNVIRIADLTLDTAAKSVTRQGRPITLSRRKFAILEYLALRVGKLVTRAELEEHVYDDRSQVLSNAIDSAISLLRRKLNADGRPDLIQTARGRGYTLIGGSPDVHP